MENEMKVLFETIMDRKQHAEAGSYTGYLFEKEQRKY